MKTTRAPTAMRVGSGAFSLVELLVVIGIIVVLIAILLPVLASVRRQANSTNCKSNLRQIYQFITLYSQFNAGYLPHGSDFLYQDPPAPPATPLSDRYAQAWTERLFLGGAIGDSDSPFNSSYTWSGNYCHTGLGVFACPEAAASPPPNADPRDLTYGFTVWASPMVSLSSTDTRRVWVKMNQLTPDHVVMCDGWGEIAKYDGSDPRYNIQYRHSQNANYMLAAGAVISDPSIKLDADPSSTRNPAVIAQWWDHINTVNNPYEDPATP